MSVAEKSKMELRFDREQHRYFVGNLEYPSVTTVLDDLNDYGFVKPEILKAAQQLGVHVHEANFLMISNRLHWESLDPALVPFVSAAKRFLRDEKVTVLASELRMHDPDLRVAGTADVVGMWRNDPWIFDWKSASVMPRTTPLQTAGYEHLYRKAYGARKRLKRAGVLLRDDGTYRIYPYSDPRDINWFLSALNLWHWKHTYRA